MPEPKGDIHKGKLAPKSNRQKKFEKLFKANIRDPKKDWATSGNTEILKRGPKRAPYLKNRPSGNSPTFRSSVGTNGGSTSSVGHSPSTGGIRTGGGSGKGGRGRSGGGGGGSAFKGGSYRKQAQRYVNRDLRQQMQVLRDEMGARKKDMQWSNSQAESLFNRSKGDLEHIFGEVNEQNNLQTKAILDRILQSQGSTNQIYDQLGNAQRQNTQGNQDALLAELSRLGIQGGGNFAQFGADANFAQNMAEQNRASSLDNLGFMGSGAANIGNLINQTSNSSMASNIGKQLNLRNDSIAGARQEYRGNVDELRDQMRVERLGKGNRIFDMFQQLEEKGYNRWFQNREANRANRLGWSNFNLSADGQNADIAFQKAAMLQEQRQQAALARANRAQVQSFGNRVAPRIQDVLW